jgi:two-component system, cell cycle response regulator DivK
MRRIFRRTGRSFHVLVIPFLPEWKGFYAFLGNEIGLPTANSCVREGELDVYNYSSIGNTHASPEEKPIRILYIEDYADNRLLIRRVLMAEGYEVLEAANAQEALKSALLEPPDLILMDINLPEVDGYTLTARIRSTPKLSHIPVVALTANVMKGDRERVLEAGCDGYIQKPVDIDQLPWQISKYLRKPRGF